MFYEVIPAKQLGNNIGCLTYSFDSPLLPGQIVLVPIRNSEVPAVVIKKVAQPNFSTKPISKILYTTPIPIHLLKLADFMKKYYLANEASTMSLILPKGITKKRRKTEQIAYDTLNITKNAKIELNKAQKTAILGLQKAHEATKLLHGVTGSGKTNIYLKMAQNALNSKKSVILLVPEIALTSQLVRVFEDTFGDIVTLIHSRQTEAERHIIWESILKNNSPRIIIGPRSALFAPVNDLGLIIVDECHEQSYFQENNPKYSTIRLASFIAKTLNIDCILGSATPLIEDFFVASSKNSIIKLTEKAKNTAVAPNIKIIDLKDRQNFTKNRYFSTPLLNSIDKNLKNGYQTLIFHNRRGSSPLTICEDCGHELLCPHCLLPLTLHADSYKLICHTCGYESKIPHTCPECGSPNILHKGFGTKLLEKELKKLFKNATVARFDADNSKSETLDALYNDVKTGKINIIIGTQAIAKGLDLPKLATVGIVQADSGLSLPDYSAEERTFELINQVIGRVGRGHLDEADVIIQSFQPEHPMINFAIKNDYDSFAKYLLGKRRKTSFPPYIYLSKISVTMKTEQSVIKKIRTIKTLLSKDNTLKASTPTPAFHEHTSNGYTWQIVIKSKSRQKLLSNLQEISKDPSIHITIDPPTLL